MNKEEWEDYKKLSGEITEKLDNTATYESWLIIQEYVDRCQQENQKLKIELSGYRQAILNDKEMLGLKEQNRKYKEVIDKAKKRIEKGIYIIPKDTNEILGILKEVE